ncbi:hypothetical protein KRX56_02240 [Dermabacteraceae bacterium TAE3-ERU27]|nr:hypothetical protein [Dermabacteraceae bacterium TAE3-ERU27]
MAEVFPAILLGMGAFLAVLTLWMLLPLRKRCDQREESSRLWLFPCASFVFVVFAAAAFGSWYPVGEVPGHSQRPDKVFSWENEYKNNHLALVDVMRGEIASQLDGPTDG